MSKTAWTGSSLPSDRIPPRSSQSPRPPSNNAQRNQNASAVPPKSKEVRRLQKLRDDLKNSTGQERDPTGGCFCQARVHPLSQYTPLCASCGLTLCTLHRPHFACPSCSAPLLTPSARLALVDDLDNQIEETLRKEEEERLKKEEARRAAAGEFPTLAGAPQSSAAMSGSPHKVLTLSSGKNKGKKSTVTVSYSVPRPAAKPPASLEHAAPGDSAGEGMRVPRPPLEVPVFRVDPSRPWANLRAMAGGGGGPVYVGSGSGR